MPACKWPEPCPALATHGRYCAVHHAAWLQEGRDLFAADVKAGRCDAKGYTPAERAAKNARDAAKRQLSLFEF